MHEAKWELTLLCGDGIIIRESSPARTLCSGKPYMSHQVKNLKYVLTFHIGIWRFPHPISVRKESLGPINSDYFFLRQLAYASVQPAPHRLLAGEPPENAAGQIGSEP